MHKNNFDFLRLFAAFMVLVSHQFVSRGSINPMVFGFRALGTVGVYIFFAISGYLIALSWMRSPRIGVFIENRLVRIWPAFALVTMFTALILGPMVTTFSLRDYFFSWVTRDYLLQLMFDLRFQLPGVFERILIPGLSMRRPGPFPSNCNAMASR